MHERTQTQLAKVLAMADSSHEGEALVAVRKAREMLSQNGLSFGDLARAAAQPLPKTSLMGLNLSFFSVPSQNLEAEIAQLQQEIFDLRTALDQERRATEQWRNRATVTEQNLSHYQSEAHRWRTLARETVEKLWDLGQNIRAEETALTPPLAASPLPKSQKTA